MNEKKVLIVDDDEDLQVLYGLYLQGEAFRVSKAYNGQEAFQHLEKDSPDLIILDMIMPVMDGETFLTKLQAQKEYNHISVIIASVNEKIPQKLLNFGNVCATLRKPFTIDTLVNKVRDALQDKKVK